MLAGWTIGEADFELEISLVDGYLGVLVGLGSAKGKGCKGSKTWWGKLLGWDSVTRNQTLKTITDPPESMKFDE